jgi:hypothetical protein
MLGPEDFMVIHAGPNTVGDAAYRPGLWCIMPPSAKTVVAVM